MVTTAEAARRLAARADQGYMDRKPSKSLRRIFQPNARLPEPEFIAANPGWQFQPINPTGGQPKPPLVKPPPVIDPLQAAREARAAQATAIRSLVSWLPAPLIDLYVQAWVQHGDAEIAWGIVRDSPRHEEFFPGIRRGDRTLRMTEQEYVSYREAFSREFVQLGISPAPFQDMFVAQVRGEKSIDEFRAQLNAQVTRVVRNIPEVRQQFASFYGIIDLTDEALIAAGIDESIGRQLLEGRITAAEIAGEAAVQGFQRGRERAELLAGPGGLNQQTARQLFSTATHQVPQLNRFAQRFNDPIAQFGIQEFEDAAVFGDTGQQRRMQRLAASEEALFTGRAQLARDPLGLVGLRKR